MGWEKKKKGSDRRWRDVVEMKLMRMGRKGGKGGELSSLENGNDTRFRGDRSGMEVDVVCVSLPSRKCEIVWRLREEDFETNGPVSELHRKITVLNLV